MRLRPEQWQQVKLLVSRALRLTRRRRVSLLEDLSLETEVREEAVSLIEVSESDAAAISDLEIRHERVGQSLLAQGQVIGGFRIERVIGRGGMGCVYFAYDEEHDRDVALKLVTPFGDAAIQEHRLLARIQDEGVARLYTSGVTEDGFHFIVMEYVDGLAIDAYCERNALGTKERLDLFVKVCEAVAAVHERQIVHRDLKPSNILVTAEGQPKILDFGIAKFVPLDATATLTTLGARPLTLAYASPEQVKGKPTTQATDVYSLGVILNVLLTGGLPYRIESSTQLNWAVGIREPVPVSQGMDGSDPVRLIAPPADRIEHKALLRRLDPIVGKALAKNPRSRFVSVSEFKRAVQGAEDSRVRSQWARLALVCLLMCLSLLAHQPSPSGQTELPSTWKMRDYRPREDHIKDMYYSSFYPNRESGYINSKEELLVGGWGDWQVTFLEFDLESVPGGAKRVEVRLRNAFHEDDRSIPMELHAPLMPWSETEGWEGTLRTEFIREIPAPDRAPWYFFDISDLYTEWDSGTRPNYGLMLQPTANSNHRNRFLSSRTPVEDDDYRPALRMLYDVAFSAAFDPGKQQFTGAMPTASLRLDGDFTLECWMKLRVLKSGTLLSQWQLGAGGESCNLVLEYVHGEAGGALRLTQSLDGGQSVVTIASVPVTFEAQMWMSLAVTFKAEDGQVQFFVNGLPYGQVQVMTLRDATVATHAYWGLGMRGNQEGEPDQVFDGLLDEARIWSRALEAEEINSAYLAEIVGDEQGLVGYWRLNGDSDDQSAFGNHLILSRQLEFSSSNGVLTPHEARVRVPGQVSRPILLPERPPID